MDISERIAKNLNNWMTAREDLCTNKKLEAKSHVGASTIQRVRNGEGNITIKNLSLIAKAFGRSADALIDVPAESFAALPQPIAMPSREMREPNARYVEPAITELIDLANRMDSKGLNLLLVMARALADEHPNANRAAG